MKAAGSTFGVARSLPSSVTGAKGWLSKLVEAIGIAVVYFLAARLGLALLSSPSDVAVFWPASGIAAGILILSGRRALMAVVIGVIAGTVAANVISDRSVLTSLCKGLCNAGEAVLVAWLLEQRFGRPFRFVDLRRVAGLFAATGLATAVSAIGGASTMTLLHTTAPYWEVWRAWFLSGAVGIVVVAPLIIGLAQMWREAPSREEWIEGVGVLSLVTLASFYAVSHKTGSWISFSPGGFVLPPLLWLTARCRPAFGLAGAFIASVSVILATTFGVGRFGDAAVPLLERVQGAQMAIVTVTIYTLVLIALFAQRKEAEDGLRESKELLAKERAMLARLHEVSSQLWLKRDLRQALDEILAGAIELLGADMGAIRIWDSARGSLRIEAYRGFKCEYLDLFRHMLVKSTPPCENVLRSGERLVIEDVEQDYRFAPFRPLARAAGYRALQSTRILSREGAPLGVLGTHFRSVHKPAEQELRLLDLYVRQAADIIERHKVEDALRESEERLRERDAQLALAGRAAQVGVYTYDLNNGAMVISEGYAALHGLPGEATETSYSEWRARVHPEDLGRAEALRDQTLANRRKEDNAEYRVVLPSGEIRWIERRGSISYGEDGRPEREVGANIDVTERKRAEQYQRTLNAELDHRVKNVLATVRAIMTHTREAGRSSEDFVARLDQRIESLARTHELLSESKWHSVALVEIIRRELAPYNERNTAIGGPNLTLKAGAAEAVAMVFHELTTNAAKYGAFSSRTGRVSVRWRWLRNGSPDRLVIDWQEIDGPPVRNPSRSGYGTSIIRELIPFELGGAVDLSFAPGGTRCRLEIPGEWASWAEGVANVSRSTH